MNLSQWRVVAIAALIGLTCGMATAQSNSKQATEAAQKHRADKASKSAPAKPGANKAVAAQGSVAGRLASCKTAAGLNVFKREQCVWDLCKGRWGRDGCPDEATNKPVER